ncbi:MAG: hypothetical protein IPP77_00030 [Bacteroidetes bacterium]|nr:hypothetical protein [Bacteroidota bacterium]
MIQPDHLFGNFFDDKNITDRRARRFAIDALAHLTAANGSNQYDSIIADLTAKIGAIDGSLDQMLIDIAQQKGATYSVDQIMEAFLEEVSYKRA